MEPRLKIGLIGCGAIAPAYMENLSGDLSGTVEVVNVERGTRVQRGDVLVQIAQDDREIRLAKAEAQLAQSRAELVDEAATERTRIGNLITDAMRDLDVLGVQLAAFKLIFA